MSGIIGRTCPECGDHFWTNKIERHYCSDDCRACNASACPCGCWTCADGYHCAGDDCPHEDGREEQGGGDATCSDANCDCHERLLPDLHCSNCCHIPPTDVWRLVACPTCYASAGLACEDRDD